MKLRCKVSFVFGWTLTLLMPLLGAFAATAFAATSPPISLYVDATDVARGLFHSEVDIPVIPGPLTLVYPKWPPSYHAPFGLCLANCYVGRFYLLYESELSHFRNGPGGREAIGSGKRIAIGKQRTISWRFCRGRPNTHSQGETQINQAATGVWYKARQWGCQGIERKFVIGRDTDVSGVRPSRESCVRWLLK
jgi:hypothetical protein